MGNCLPFSKYVEPNMKLRSSENNSSSQVESSVQDHSKVNSDSDSMKFNSKLEQSFDSGSKEEIFFDSNDQAWLESDAEDFQSVASDSAPVDIGTAPPVENNSRKNSQSDLLMNTESSSTDSKKQLIDLFRDSFPNEVDEDKNTKEHTASTTMDSTASHLSPKCRVTTTSKQSNRLKSKSALTNCCLPNLVRSMSSSSSEKKSSSSSEKKKKR